MIIVYTFIIAAFFSSILGYLVFGALSPYVESGHLNMSNLIIVSVVSNFVVGGWFAFLHLIIDKLFFRRFYEKPNLWHAYRRGLLLGILLIGFSWFRILDLWYWHLTVLYFLLVFLLELLANFISNNDLNTDKNSEAE